MFVVGANGQNAENMFKQEQLFISKLLNTYKISDQEMLPGVVTYGAKTIIKLGEVSDKTTALNRFANLRYSDLGKGLDVALKKVQSETLLTTHGARKGVPKSVLIFINDKSEINSDILDKLDMMTKNKIDVSFVAIGPNLSENDLRTVISDPVKIVFVPNSGDLEKELVDVIDAVKEGIL